jgi:hypothetical protein
MRDACSAGLPMVADAAMKSGSLPWKRAMRWSRLTTLARWEPNTPRYMWSSSTTTKRRLAKKRAQLAWCGRMLACSMSGLVMSTPARSRAARRASPGVSPS